MSTLSISLIRSKRQEQLTFHEMWGPGILSRGDIVLHAYHNLRQPDGIARESLKHQQVCRIAISEGGNVRLYRLPVLEDQRSCRQMVMATHRLSWHILGLCRRACDAIHLK